MSNGVLEKVDRESGGLQESPQHLKALAEHSNWITEQWMAWSGEVM